MTCSLCNSLIALPDELLVNTLYLAGNPRISEVCSAFQRTKTSWFQGVRTAYFQTHLIRQLFAPLFFDDLFVTVRTISIQFITVMKREWLQESFKDISSLAQHQSAALIEDWSSTAFFGAIAGQLDISQEFVQREIDVSKPVTRVEGMQRIHKRAQKIDQWMRDRPEIQEVTHVEVACEMPIVPRLVARMTHLTELKLTGCKIFHVMNEIGSLIFLEKLDLSHNRLRTLPRSMQFLAELEELRLGDNQFEYLPRVVYGLTNLHTLDVSGNAIKEFLPRFSNLKKMQSLNFSRNAFALFPPVLKDFSLLSSLVLERNQISVILPSISLNKRLRHLDLRHNPLKYIPSEELYVLARDHNLELIELSQGQNGLLHPEVLYYLQAESVLAPTTPASYDIRSLDGLIHTLANVVF